MQKKENYKGIIRKLADKLKNSLLAKIAAYSLAGSIASLSGCGSYEVKLGIENIKEFLEKCPTKDPVYEQIRNDFEIRRNGKTVRDIECSEPISQMPTSQYTDELIALQVLRTIYYMDYGRSNHLPWTTTTSYEWVKQKIGGVNIDDRLETSYCCMYWKDKPYIVIETVYEGSREQRKHWAPLGLAEIVALYMHEVRHVDGFHHVNCSGELQGYVGCDQTYDENNLSPIGVQYWLHANWLNGNLYNGFSCLSPDESKEIADYHLYMANRYNKSFVDNKPPILTMPEFPGGKCQNKN